MAFKNPIPATYIHANEQTAQYANLVTDMALPTGHIFVGATTRQGWTQPLMVQKGFTHYDRSKAGYENGGNENAYDGVLPGRKYLSVPRVNDSFGMNSSTTKSQAEGFADQMDLSNTLTVLETQENVNYLAPNAIQWKWFHDRWKARCDAATTSDGKPRYRCHNYFRFTGGIFALGQVDWEKHRQLYTTPVANWNTITYIDSFGINQTAVNDYSPNGTLSGTNLIVEGVYQANPDVDRDTLMGSLFAMDVSRMQGFTPGQFLFGVREWRPNWLEGTDYSDGRFMRSMKVKLSPSFLLTCGFMSQEFGKCGIEYGTIDYQPLSKKPVEYYAPVHTGTDYWKSPAGAGSYSPFPYYGGAGNGRFQFGGGDNFYFGMRLWHDTMGQVASGTPTFLRYRVNGGAWIEKAASESDLINARRDQRGFVRARIAGGKMGVCYLNLYDNHTKKTIEFQHPTNPGITWTRDVAGTGVKAEMITL